MGMADAKGEIADIVGVPTFFVTKFVFEDAGSGCMRLYGCIERRGELIPQYIAIIPCQAVLEGSKMANETAMSLLKEALAHVH